MSALRSVTDDSFAEEVLSSGKTVLVDFWAEWCPPCRALGPILEQLSDQHGEKIEFVAIDADDNPRTAATYQAISLPMMKIFQNGEDVKTIIGAKPKPALEAELAPFLT